MVIVPIFKSDDELNLIKNYLDQTLSDLDKNNNSYYFDDRDKMSPGFKFNEWEMKGVPLRIEIGMRDCENKVLTIVRRDKNEKKHFSIEGAANIIIEQLSDIQDSLFNQALDFKNTNTFKASNYEEFKKMILKGGFC